MEKVLSFYCATAFIVLMFIGCASFGTGSMYPSKSAGKEFNYAKRSEFAIGKTTQNEAEILVGKPLQSETVSNEKGNFQVLTYIYAYAPPHAYGGNVSVSARAFTLEFLDNLLNAYIYNSSFSEDSTDFKLDLVPQIIRGSSSKLDVTKIMGEPTGKARCPSTIGLIKSACAHGPEVWLWTHVKTEVKKSVEVTFDGNGIVADVSSSIKSGSAIP